MTNINKNKKRVSKKASMAVMGLAALGIIGISGLGVSAMSSASDQDGVNGLASRLATKFGLNEKDVASEIDSYHTEKRAAREAERNAEISAALQKKVDQGLINADQKTAIENKLKENHKAREAEREAYKDSGKKPTKEEVKAKRNAQQSEMDTWLKEQGINLDLKDVMPSPGERHGPSDMEGGN